MTCRGQNTTPRCSFVQWTYLTCWRNRFFTVSRRQFQDRQRSLQFSRFGISQDSVDCILTCAFQVQALDETSVVSFANEVFLVLTLVIEFEFKIDQINRRFGLPRLVLFNPSQKCLRVEKAAHPEALGRAVVLPLFQKVDAFGQVDAPAGE